MNAPENFVRVVEKVRYDVSKAELIADNAYWDGHNWSRSGRNQFLYRTPSGRFFFVNVTQWQGEKDTLIPCSQEEAIEAYEGGLTEHAVEYEAAFPGVKIVEA